MKQQKHTVRAAVWGLALAALLTGAASAQELTVDPDVQFCFSADDFSVLEADDGIFLTAVPRSSVAVISYGGRALRAGDALPVEALDQLTLEANSLSRQNASIGYYTISEGAVTAAREVQLSILPKKNEPPEADDEDYETYRNIPLTDVLEASDPENGVLTYQVVKEPKRGTVEIQADGTFTYTPDENKVGKDRFTYTVTDEAGQTSEPAEITIEIKKPADKATYADMADDADAFAAMWLKETGLFTGSTVGGNLCFEPEAAVTRGEFLVMAMKLVDAQASQSGAQSGFADEAATPVWMQPYIVSALSNGMISGTQTEAGVEFRPADQLTCAEAAVMLQNILQLPSSSLQAVGSFETEHALPAWATEAAAALSSAGIQLELTSDEAVMTRRTAARLLYQVQQLLGEDTLPTFYWVQ